MPTVKITLDKDLPKGAYSFELTPIETDEVIIPEIPDLKPEPLFPQVENVKFLKDAESINNNSLIPFEYDGDTYLVCHNADNDKSQLFNYSKGFKYIQNLDLVLTGSEVRGVVHSIVKHEDDYYGLVKIGKEIYFMQYRKGTDLKAWDILGHVMIEGAKDCHHDLFINEDNHFMLHGRARNVIDYPGETNQIYWDRRSVKQKIYGPFPKSVLGSAIYDGRIDPLNHDLIDYLIDQFRKGFYGSRSIVINGKCYTFINVFWQNSARKTGKRTDREITGTGDIYPCVVRDYGDITAWEKHLINQTPFLRDWPHEHCKGFNPEVGQLHVGGVLDKGDYLEIFFVWRIDPHYLEMDGQQPTKLYAGTLDKQALIDWFDWKEKQ